MRLSLRLVPVTGLALLLPAQGDPPAWWFAGHPPVIDPAAAPNNHGPVNIGQAKWMAAQALKALQIAAPEVATRVRADLAGTPPYYQDRIVDLSVASPTPAGWLEQQQAPIRLGQLKALAQPFYNRLNTTAPAWVKAQIDLNHGGHATLGQNYWQAATHGFVPGGFYPWNPLANDPSNHAIATIGQLKAVFSLRFETYGATQDPNDSDGDGIPDEIESLYGLNPVDASDAALDADGDGVSYFNEINNQTNPNDPASTPVENFFWLRSMIFQYTGTDGEAFMVSIDQKQVDRSCYFGASRYNWLPEPTVDNLTSREARLATLANYTAAWNDPRLTYSNIRDFLDCRNLSTSDWGWSVSPSTIYYLATFSSYSAQWGQSYGFDFDPSFTILNVIDGTRSKMKLASNFVQASDRTFNFLKMDYCASTSGGIDPNEDILLRATPVKVVIPKGHNVSRDPECNGTPMNVFTTNPADESAADASLGILESNLRVDLVPVEIAVDANRDGNITFDAQDQTTEHKPFRFWINNDQDNVEYDEPILVEKPDFFDRETIATKRDLEDFCRLQVQVGLSNQLLRDGKLQIGLMFQNSSEGSPGIRIWNNQSHTGNLDYLQDDSAANAQIALSAFEKFTPDNVTLIPKSYWASRKDSTAHLIFEGTATGTGNLVVTIHDKSGMRLGNGGGIWMKLLDVRAMYQRARIENEPEQIPDPWINANPPAQTWLWDPWNWPYSADPNAANITAVFVHGWRLKYMDYMNWSDTSYKRLWHQGFKGKFYSFRWPCFSGDNNGIPYGVDEKLEEVSTINYLPIFPPGGTTYNASEYRAWLCGPALASFVNQLSNPDDLKLFAHSMGNVITGSAMKAGMQLTNYAMCNSAMAAMAYDADSILKIDPTTNNKWADIFHPLDPAHKTPDTNHDPTIRTGYGLNNKFNLTPSPTVFSFGLPNDQCLGKWSLNNLYFKPNYQYLYEDYSVLMPFPLAYQSTPFSSFRSVTVLPEAMGYVTKSLTRTAGSDLRTVGSINGGFQDMSNWGPNASHSGFGKAHSAQWRWNNQSTHLFWQMLVKNIELK